MTKFNQRPPEDVCRSQVLRGGLLHETPPGLALHADRSAPAPLGRAQDASTQASPTRWSPILREANWWKRVEGGRGGILCVVFGVIEVTPTKERVVSLVFQRARQL